MDWGDDAKVNDAWKTQKSNKGQSRNFSVDKHSVERNECKAKRNAEKLRKKKKNVQSLVSK